MVVIKNRSYLINGIPNQLEVRIKWNCFDGKTMDVLYIFKAFVGSWFLIFFVAVLYEGLKTIRDQLAKRESRRRYAERRNPQSAL